MKSELTITLAKNTPKAWEDFSRFFLCQYQGIIKEKEFEKLPFELQLGIFFKYFKENTVELDLSETDEEILNNVIVEAFLNFERIISHYS